MKKNPTPQQIALACAGLQTFALIGLFFILQTIFNFYDFTPTSFGVLVLVFLLTFALNYAIIINALKNFIYRKVKTIYKSIHKAKQAKGKVFNELNTNEDIIGKMNQEVESWTADTQKEIADLKTTETFRKEFIGNVSHELKTPIFSIQGYIQTLLDGGLYDNAVNYRYLKKADKNVDRLINIVDDLEVITKHESGKMFLDYEVFDIVQLANEAIELMETNADVYDVKLQIKKGFSPQIKVDADKDKIQQVLVNLIGNSIKYGKEGGLTQIGFYDMDENILIEVSDDGIGVPKKDLPRLFERFYRVDKSRSRDAGGTGLGLAIVKHIIEAHKQTINVRSTEDIGSTFGFTLKKSK